MERSHWGLDAFLRRLLTIRYQQYRWFKMLSSKELSQRLCYWQM